MYIMSFEETLEFVNNPILNYDGEEWKSHPIYTDIEGSNLGRIRRTRKGETKIKKQREKKYEENRHDFVFSYIISGRGFVLYSAKIILECFQGLGNNKGYQCDHINSTSYDNRIENLRWVDGAKENIGGNESTKEKMRLAHKGTSRKKEYIHISEFDNFNKKTEKWKKHPYYENIEVSNLGRVIEKIGDYFIEKKINKNNKGYLWVTIGKDPNKKQVKVHRLVAETWIPNPDNKPEIDHINNDKTDNSVSNLKWSTRSENMNNEITKSRISNAQKKKVNESYIKPLNIHIKHFED